MDNPDLLPSITPSLSDQLRRRAGEILCSIIRANYSTQYAQAASELAEFRDSVADLVDAMDDHVLTDTFRDTVHYTSYDSYAPFIARFFEKPCKVNDVINLLAPGLPKYFAISSSTSGGLAKYFPRYSSEFISSGTASWPISNPIQKRAIACLWSLSFDQIDVEDGGNRSIASIYLTDGSAAAMRSALHLVPEEDTEKMGTFILDHAAPYATGFIKNWRSFLLVHALFTIGSKSLQTMFMTFISTFVDMMRHLDTEFDMVMDCIENGTIPDIDGIDQVRHYLEVNITPDPERAAELRSLGRPSSKQGWCGHAWPSLRLVSGIASGSFASYVSAARRYLGPNIAIHSNGYASSEAWLGPPYNPLELNQFKLRGSSIIELLDVSKSGDSISSLSQLWEVEVGRRYEPVLTTRNGLWRYRLGDVVEVAGFDPTDGVPVVRFIERRNVLIRFPDFMITELELRAAMSSLVQNMDLNVVDWTAAVDDRGVPQTIGFFIELMGDQAPEVSSEAMDHLFDGLSRSNKEIACALEDNVIRKPTIWLVRAGTFSAFRQLKLDESRSISQVKVPIVLPKAAYVTWFLDRAVQEL